MVAIIGEAGREGLRVNIKKYSYQRKRSKWTAYVLDIFFLQEPGVSA